MSNVLVTGGAGYVGSHICLALAQSGFTPITLDSLEHGHEQAVQWGPLHIGSTLDRAVLHNVLSTYRPLAVIHCAAHTLVGESTQQPQRYWRNNVEGTQSLIAAMTEFGITPLVFSSTSAVYGEPAGEAMREDQQLSPQSPYGASKLAAEELVRSAPGLSSVVLRYFNAAGADPEARIGEAHEPETHLIPIVLDVAAGRQTHLTVYGSDHATPDGTCVRDYVHVCDVAEIHVAALRRLLGGGASLVANIGCGTGYSVRQVIAAVERVTGRTIPRQLGPARPGDPPSVVADCSVARRELGWHGPRSNLDRIVSDAWNWHRRLRAAGS
jgi:UDP-arabinose 4-epimerase